MKIGQPFWKPSSQSTRVNIGRTFPLPLPSLVKTTKKHKPNSVRVQKKHGKVELVNSLRSPEVRKGGPRHQRNFKRISRKIEEISSDGVAVGLNHSFHQTSNIDVNNATTNPLAFCRVQSTCLPCFLRTSGFFSRRQENIMSYFMSRRIVNFHQVAYQIRRRPKIHEDLSHGNATKTENSDRFWYRYKKRECSDGLPKPVPPVKRKP